MFGDNGLSIAVFSTLGLILYESTRGYYVLAKSQASAKEAAVKALKLPVIYAFLLGIIASNFDVQFSSSLTSTFTYFSGAYTVFGMMMLGIGLSAVGKSTFSRTFTVLSFVAKFLAYPLAIGLFVYLDSSNFHLFSNDVHKIMLVLSVTPMAINTVTYATYLKARPEEASLTVMLSTLFAFIYVPVFVAIFL